jgi:hypothetical protein
MSYNARIRTTKRLSYNSYTFLIVTNWRDESKGMKTNHRSVAYLGTYKEHFLYSLTVQNKLWLKIDLAINKLLKSGEITTLDKVKIEKRFAEFCPRPVPSTLVLPKPLITLQSVREKYGL